MENCVNSEIVERKKLADISNLPQQPKNSSQVGNVLPVFVSTKEYIEKFQKDRMTLVELLAEKNKIIELSGIELQKSRINLQKLQQQNSQLAQVNSQMLGDLNSGKDRLKALNHELGCKNGLLKALKFEQKAKIVAKLETKKKYLKVGTSKSEEAGESDQAAKVDKSDDKASNTKRRQQSSYQASGTSNKQVKTEENAENKRLHLRRQSARFKPEVPTEDLFEIDDAKFYVCPLDDDQMNENNPTPIILAVKEDKEECSNPSFGSQEFRRSSVGRPLRRAVEKVQSYKEMNLRVKMRRPG